MSWLEPRDILHAHPRMFLNELDVGCQKKRIFKFHKKDREKVLSEGQLLESAVFGSTDHGEMVSDVDLPVPSDVFPA